ncbi:MAG: mechanosensitive ion channel family protein [Desulfobacterales bacterium]|jgi:small-conductance mechanosensitive channel|nr:mechanosensitive ion channel family protein [Desulfobacterales bacterium]
MFSEIILYHNQLVEWLIAVAMAMFFFLAVEIARRVIYKKLSAFAAKTDTIWDNLLAELIDRLNILCLLVLAVYLGSLQLSLPEKVNAVLGHTVAIFVLIQIAVLCTHSVSFWVNRYRSQKLASNAGAVTTLTSVGFLLRMMIWIILLLIGLDNLGFNITTLIAGLGISGIAVALAIQNVLGDLFASFSIVLDKPFVIGDFIIIDDYMGTIEHVGLKTTRIRSLSGEQLIFANADMLKSRIRNYRRMYERRVVFSIGVVYQTPHEKISQIPEMIRKAIEKNSKTRFDRAHFKEYGDFALKFEVVYWVHDPDFTLYMDIQQAINLDILKQFGDAGIEFAYPTQTLMLQRPSSPPSK